LKRTAQTTKWIIASQEESKARYLSEKCNISLLLAKLLLNRGIETEEEVNSFFDTSFDAFHDPFLMHGMDKAVSVVLESVAVNDKIIIYGDYDVDGITSSVVLYKYLKSLGCTVGYHIPSRSGEGYGLNNAAINEFAKDGYKLLITVDSGITANSEIKFAKSLGMKVVITDHHFCIGELPVADGIINPRKEICNYPFKELAGVGVVFKLICALDSVYNRTSVNDSAKKICENYSDFIALGTIADVMPLLDENRIIVKHGLTLLKNTKNIGLAALLNEIFENNFSQKKINTSSVSFNIVPKINAAGRLSSAMKAVDLFISDDPEKARICASELASINKERQLLENEIYNHAIEKINSTVDFKNDSFILISDDTWHHGVIGIVASRICEKYNMPTILVSFLNEESSENPNLGKGSGRSIKGLNIVNALSSCEDILQKYGGHELAAGLSVTKENFDELKKRLNEYARQNCNLTETHQTINIDCEIETDELTHKTYNELLLLEPNGHSNPTPIFVYRNATITDIVSIGNDKHTKLTVRKNGLLITALCFGIPKSKFNFCINEIIDIACNLDVNEFRNQRNAQLIVRSCKISEESQNEEKEAKERFDKLKNGEALSVSKKDFPTKDDFKEFFRLLKKMSPYENERVFPRTYNLIDLSYIHRKLKFESNYNISFFKILVIADVFTELKLIEKKEKTVPSFLSDSQLEVAVNYSNKINLADSRLLQRLADLGKE